MNASNSGENPTDSPQPMPPDLKKIHENLFQTGGNPEYLMFGCGCEINFLPTPPIIVRRCSGDKCHCLNIYKVLDANSDL